MADSILESNLILNTKTTAPDMSGVKALGKGFTDIERQLTALTTKTWTIKLTVDSSALKAAGLGGGSGGGIGGGPGGVYSVKTPGGFAVGPGGSVSYGRQTTTFDKEGSAVVTNLQKIAAIQGRIEHINTEIAKADGTHVKSIQEQVHLNEKAALQQERKVKLATELRRLEQQQARLASEGRGMGSVMSLGQTPSVGFVPGPPPSALYRPTNQTGGTFLTQSEIFARIQASEREAVQRRAQTQAEQSVQDALYNKAAIQGNRYRNKTELASDKAAEKMAVRSDVFETDTHGRAYLQDYKSRVRTEQANDRATAAQAAKVDQEFYDRKVAIATADRKERERQARLELGARARAERRGAGEHVSEFEAITKREGMQAGIAAAEGRGFQVRGVKTTGDALTGQLTRQTEMARVAGNAFSGLTTEVHRFNEATGKVTTTVLGHTASIKYLGDSLMTAASKVLTWTVATAAIFATIGAITMASKAVVELESNTVLLARVGRTLGDSFEDRLAASKELTASIIDLTTVYGGNAEAATRAATVFARAGRTQKEILEGVRVSLIASKVAELDVEDAARLISSAMLQFNLKASELMPTLDVLNTLSNNYRVSTDDLLQSISRAGSVFADHGGRLSELASLTAVVSQETSRSGAEIGNAFKTIISQLDRLDVQKDLFDQLGISTVEFSGESKSLAKILFEESLALDRLSTSEQKQLTLKQAGIRQRGILVASLKTAPESLRAQNVSLTTSSSAEAEFQEGAKVTAERLSRLRADFVKLAELGSGPLKILANSMIALASTVLKILSLFDGLPIKAIAAAASFLAFRSAINGMVSSLITMSAQMIATAQVSVVTQAAIGNWVTILAAGAIALYTLYDANTNFTQSLAESNTAVQSNITSEENRRKAIIDTTEAIYRLIDAKDKDVDAKARRLALDDLPNKLLNLPAGPVTEESVSEANRQAQQESIDRNKKLIENDIIIKKQALEEAKEAEKLATNWRTYISYSPFDTNEAQAKRTQVGSIKGIAARELAERELQEAYTKSAELKVVDSNFNQTKEQKALGKEIHGSYMHFYNRDREQAGRGYRESVDNGIDSQAASYNELRNSVYKYANELERAAKLNQDSNDQNYLDDQKKLNELINEQTNAYIKLKNAQNAARKEQILSGLGSENRLRDSLYRIGSQQSRGLSLTSSPYGDALASIDSQRQSQLDRINRNQGALIPGISLGTGQALRQDTEEALVKLKDLELSKAEAILEAEKDIAIERKKSADEALRAVGALSDEDKLRFRAQASYFAANPGKKISIEEQLNMSSRDNSLANTFYRNRVETLGDARSPLADMLRASGLGGTHELDKGEAEVAAARHGRTDKEIVEQAQGNANAIDDQLAMSRGGQGGGMVTEFLRGISTISGMFGAEGKSNGGKIGVEVSGDAFNLKPLVDAFRESVTIIINARHKETVEQVQAIVDQQKNLPANKPRRTFGNF